MDIVSPTLARYLQERWVTLHGGLSHASGVYLALEESGQAYLNGREEVICRLHNGLAYTGMLDKKGKVLCIRLETAERTAHLPCWKFESVGLSPILLLRLNAELTQTQLAQRARCTQKDISRWETGARNPTRETLNRLRAAAQKNA